MFFKVFRSCFTPLCLFCVAGLLFFEFYTYFITTREYVDDIEKKTVREYEMSLCLFAFSRIMVESDTNKCPRQGIVTTVQDGELSKNMWEYANVLAYSLTLELKGYIPVCLHYALNKVFQNITIPTLSSIGHCQIPLKDSVSVIDDWTDARQSVVIKGDDLYSEVVVNFLDLVKTHFVFRKEKVEYARRFFQKASRESPNTTYVGVYISKTSYIYNQQYDDVYPSVKFFHDAMDVYRKEFPNVLFIVITDMKAFWKDVFEQTDVYIVSESSMSPIGSVLSVLSHCNHTILSSGDIPVWGAVLSGGKAILSYALPDSYNNLISSKKNWHYLKTNKYSEKME